MYHTKQLQQTIEELQEEHTNVTIVYGDYYNAYKWILGRAALLGFDPKSSQKACCGGGGDYDFSLARMCGAQRTARHDLKLSLIAGSHYKILASSKIEWKIADFSLCRIEVLCHDINIHIPRHISSRIPSYNLLYLNEATWNWHLMKTAMTMCRVYDKEQNYIAFDELAPEDSQPVTFLKRVIPDYA
ncbi:hypothetical protein GH714_009472 [Hevea brasiliensis]|uniref:Uncharacterized protein n=1 Tax=Hevea brasiliensis TaxID=3981 RepID=A0A6A6MH74_HEVBR|nr:hypothetical protein GH714_009472 [Hevea brasiliensis]